MGGLSLFGLEQTFRFQPAQGLLQEFRGRLHRGDLRLLEFIVASVGCVLHESPSFRSKYALACRRTFSRMRCMRDFIAGRLVCWFWARSSRLTPSTAWRRKRRRSPGSRIENAWSRADRWRSRAPFASAAGAVGSEPARGSGDLRRWISFAVLAAMVRIQEPKLSGFSRPGRARSARRKVS